MYNTTYISIVLTSTTNGMKKQANTCTDNQVMQDITMESTLCDAQ